jgi:hypothetical protein
LIKEFKQIKGSPEGDVIEVQIKRLRNRELATLEGALEYNQNMLNNPNWMPSTKTKTTGHVTTRSQYLDDALHSPGSDTTFSLLIVFTPRFGHSPRSSPIPLL